MDFFKLMINSVFGNTAENERKQKALESSRDREVTNKKTSCLGTESSQKSYCQYK